MPTPAEAQRAKLKKQLREAFTKEDGIIDTCLLFIYIYIIV